MAPPAAGYRRAVLRDLLANHLHPVLHLDPPDYRGGLLDEYRRAMCNAAVIQMAIDKTSDPTRRPSLEDAREAEKRIAQTCDYLIELRGEARLQ